MIHVSRAPEFSSCGNMNSVSMRTPSHSRQRSHSYYILEDNKDYGVQTQMVEAYLRPRSRYVFTFNLKTCAVFII